MTDLCKLGLCRLYRLIDRIADFFDLDRECVLCEQYNATRIRYDEGMEDGIVRHLEAFKCPVCVDEFCTPGQIVRNARRFAKAKASLPPHKEGGDE